MNTSDVTIIVPIYNLNSLRFNNFCFLIKELNNLGCPVVVSEQKTDTTTTIEEYLVGYKNINHISFDYKLDKINKSKLINDASKRTFTEFIWVVDGDFYTDFSEVIKLTDTSYDFIRPFSDVRFLNKTETYELHSSGKLNLQQQEDYKTNDQTGKFSFIVRASEFTRVGGMNEDYTGWGFQDLDFVENRLKNTVSYANTDLRGYHMYHAPAPKSDVNINRQLYVNYKTQHIDEIITSKLKEYSGKATTLGKKNVYLKNHTSTPSKKTPPRVQTRVLSKWKAPEYGVVYSTNSRVFYPGVDVITVRDSASATLKNVNGTFSKVSQPRHFLYYYFEYICHIHELLEEDKTVLFANDAHCKTNAQITELLGLFKCVNSNQLVNEEDRGFTSLYAESQRTSAKLKYSSLGSFVVNSNQILKNDFDFYYNIFESFSESTTTDYLKLTSELKNIFLD